jgi:hypothetical protein
VLEIMTFSAMSITFGLSGQETTFATFGCQSEPRTLSRENETFFIGCSLPQFVWADQVETVRFTCSGQ